MDSVPGVPIGPMGAIEIASGSGAELAAPIASERELPPILYVRDLAQFLRISEKALRHRVARAQVPRPFRSGKVLAWTRAAVITWLGECGRAAGPAKMKITTRPYANDTTRFHVDIRFMNPCNEHDTIRRRLVAPPGLDDKQARSWGERQVPLILRELVGATGDAANVAPKETPARGPRMTLAEFYDSRFVPEHVALQKRATQDGYHSIYAHHIGPLLADVPLADVDEDRISKFRADLRKRLGVATTNLVLSKLAKMLRFAKKRKLIAVLPEVEKLPAPKRKPKPVFSDQQIATLNDAAAGRSSESLLICLLALDANLRVSEICALEWGDIDFAQGTVTVQHNVYKGETQEPKGEIRTIALSNAVKRALAKHQQRQLQAGEPQGPLVLYRRSQHTGWEWVQHTPHSIRHALNESQSRGELRRSGPHLLRHTGLTRLARLGATPYIIQSMARHARLQTTQDYLHMQQVTLSREAADLLDNAAAKPRGKRVAKRANAR